MARAQFRGFLLTAHYAEERGKPVLVLWLKSPQGPVRAVVSEPPLVFFIGRDVEEQKLSGIAKYTRKQLPLKDMAYRDVDGLYFDNLKSLMDAREQLQSNGVRTYEADIRPLERFLMERFICGTIEVAGEVIQGAHIQLENTQARACGDLDLAFSLLSLDIETSMQGGLLSVGMHQLEFRGSDEEKRLVLMHGKPVGPVDESIPIEWMADAPSLLKRMLEIIRQWDPDILTGWHVVGFDFKFLERKANHYGIVLNMGREGDKLQIYERYGASFAAVNGRVVLDGPWAFKNNFYSFENFKLDTVAHEVLGQGKDIEASGLEKVREIERRYREDRYALARYNLLDAELVNRVILKTGLFELMLERSRISGLLLEKTGLSTAAFDHFMLPRLHRKGHVAPNVLDIDLEGHAPGGHVFDPIPGLHEHVIVLDFKSLYPSIMRTFHIDPYSRMVAQQEIETSHNLDDILNTPIGINFSRQEHFLPDFLTELTRRRGQAKHEKRPALAQAIKILMNSFYGVMGSRGCRFHHSDLPSAITGTGKWILETSRSWIESHGNKVLYGDTDSLFVQLKTSEISHAWERAHELAQELNLELAKIIKKRFDTDSCLEVEFEKYFRKVFFAPLRGGEGAAKKRYAAWQWTQEELNSEAPEGHYIFSGLEVVRQDWTKLAKIYQRELYRRLFQGLDIQEWTKDFVNRIKNREFSNELIYRKRLTKSLDEYKKNIPPHARAAMILAEHPDFSHEAEGMRQIRYLMTSRGPMPVQLKPQDIDFQHYIEKQIRPLAESVLWYFDKKWDDLEGGSQLDLW